jgi:hypothetical protein
MDLAMQRSALAPDWTAGAPLSSLRLLRARFRLRVRDGRWPRYKGFLLHGALGATLSRLAPEAFAALMGDDEEAGRPYALLPPLDEATDFLPGSRLVLEMTFFNAATACLPACLLALRQMGAAGIGQGRARFDLDSACAVWPEGESCFDDEMSGTLSAFPEPRPAALLLAATPPETPGSLTLGLRTPLRLKADNRLVREAPGFALLMHRLLGRAAMLDRAAGGPGLPAALKQDLLAQAAAIEPAGHRLAWVEWPRHSSRQGADMLFGGLVGELGFRGELAPFLPWLRLAEYIHLGGKTTFGLGAVRIPA